MASSKVKDEICFSHLKARYTTNDLFDDGEAIYMLLQSNRFKTSRHLAEALGVDSNIIEETLEFYYRISLHDQDMLRSQGKVTREECRRLLEVSKTFYKAP